MCSNLHTFNKQGSIKLRTLLLLVLSIAVTDTFGTDYYISKEGNDHRSGTSIKDAWQTIDKVNATSFSAGDRVRFKGKHTFPGVLKIDSGDCGDPNNPLTISSYGDGRSSIDGNQGDAIDILSCTGVAIENINVMGVGRKSGNKQGIGIHVRDSNYVTIKNVEASGFQKAGVQITSSSHIKVTHIYAHNNGFAGIFAAGGNANIYVGHCRAISNPGDPTITNNHSGNGILYYGTRHSMIEFCEASNNGWDQPKGPPNGPVGIWTAGCDNITIQYCISHNNQSTSGDGGGFDLDGGTQNSTIQYCYSYDNGSSGFLMWEYGSRRGIKNNTVRYCISENDRQGGFRFGTSGPGGVSNIRIYNNVVYNDKWPAVVYHGGDVNDVYFNNNIFIISSNEAIVVETWSQSYFQGNCYWQPGGEFNIKGYADFNAWVYGTGQEKVNNNVVGLNKDPLLINPGNGAKLTDPTKLPALLSYKLIPGSPCINAGLDMKRTFNIDPGDHDFYGNTIPSGNRYNMGVCE